jgi:hypothetical protein
MNPSEDLTLSKFCEKIESDNNNLCITHRKLKPSILMIWTFFHRIIFLKNRFGFFFLCVKSTTPRCHSSFYRVLLSLVVRHFWVSVILNSFIITWVVRHFNCPESKIREHIVFALSVCLCQRLGRGHQCFTKHLVRFWNTFESVILFFFNFAVWVRVCKLYDDIMYILDWTEE